jgi:hypothetical protein
VVEGESEDAAEGLEEVAALHWRRPEQRRAAVGRGGRGGGAMVRIMLFKKRRK